MNTETAKAHNERVVCYKGSQITVKQCGTMFLAQWWKHGEGSAWSSALRRSRVQARKAAVKEINKQL